MLLRVLGAIHTKLGTFDVRRAAVSRRSGWRCATRLGLSAMSLNRRKVLAPFWYEYVGWAAVENLECW